MHVYLGPDPKQQDRREYLEDITRWREDMNVMFEWHEQYLTSERRKVRTATTPSQ